MRSPWIHGAMVSLSLLVAGPGCHHAGEGTTGNNPGDGGAAAVQGPPVPFQVRPGATDLVYFWFDDHGVAHSAGSQTEIPVDRRTVVRVDPPRPELRVPGMVYLADLRAPRADGTYAVQSVAADRLSAELATRMGIGTPGTPAVAQNPSGTQGTPGDRDGGAAVATASQVIVYGASWCSACHQAAAYLRQRQVPFIEKDIEREPGAQAEMAAKAQRAGIPLGSIPILDVHGHMMVGFSAQAIERALAGG